MKKITAYTERGILLALSNFMPCCNLGYEAAKNEMVKVLTACETSEQASKALNSHRWTASRFSPDKTLENGYTVKAVDYCGNVEIIKVTNC